MFSSNDMCASQIRSSMMKAIVIGVVMHKFERKQNPKNNDDDDGRDLHGSE